MFRLENKWQVESCKLKVRRTVSMLRISEKGCDAVRIEKEIELSYLERLFLKDVAAQNRAKGVFTANDICRNYRREGLYFDELIDRARNGGK